MKIVENTLKYLMNVKQNNSWAYGFDKYISKAFETLKLLNVSKYAYKWICLDKCVALNLENIIMHFSYLHSQDLEIIQKS